MEFVKARTVARLAWSLWLLSVLLLAAGLPLGEPAGVGLRGLVESATYATVGAIVASRHPETPIGRLFCALGVVVALEFFGTEYSAEEQFIAPGSLPGAGWIAWAAGASTELLDSTGRLLCCCCSRTACCRPVGEWQSG